MPNIHVDVSALAADSEVGEGVASIAGRTDAHPTPADEKSVDEVEPMAVVPPPPEVQERRNLRAEAMSLTHLLTHSVHNPYCDACVKAKLKRIPTRRKGSNAADAPQKFGDLVNADYIVAQSEDSMGLTGEKDALVIVDRATNYKDCFPLMSRSADDAYGALDEYFGSTKPKRIYTDNAAELIKACKDHKYSHDKSTPYRHQSNAYCERTVRSVIDGARTILELSLIHI